MKALFAPLTHLQTDVKYLTDIAHYRPYILPGFPKYRYTIRDVKTGAVFVTYGSEVCVLYAELTVRRLLKHPAKHGIRVEEVVIRTDLGSEFDGTVIYKKDRGFTHVIEKELAAHHHLNRPHCPNDNADVESFRSHGEPEFFDIEDFRDTDGFRWKITTCRNHRNYGRPNGNKWNKTPLEILTEAAPHIPMAVATLRLVLRSEATSQSSK